MKKDRYVNFGSLRTHFYNEHKDLKNTTLKYIEGASHTLTGVRMRLNAVNG